MNKMKPYKRQSDVVGQNTTFGGHGDQKSENEHNPPLFSFFAISFDYPLPATHHTLIKVNKWK